MKPWMLPGPRLPQAIVVRLHVRKINAFILTPESWCLNSSQSWSAGLSIQDEATDAARAALQRANYQAGVIHLLS